MRQLLQQADWIKGEMPNIPTLEIRLKQESIKNVEKVNILKKSGYTRCRWDPTIKLE